MRIYNTLTRKKEEFISIDDTIKIYACGITPQDKAHLGHAVAAIRFNFIRNYLLYRRDKVIFVQNITDIDDKIIAKSKETGQSILEITEVNIKAYKDGMKALGIKDPDHEPRVTQYIPQIITYIQELEEKGFAYRTEEGDVYFDVARFNNYGQLSGRKVEDLLEGVRKENKGNKKNPLDFALWKSEVFEGAAWDSPWGMGRPGWHIECSVMSNTLLAKRIDIHCGGLDLIFPHHENEIAQCEAHNDEKFVNYWIHSGLLKINGVKMSKSLNNFITLEDGLRKYGPQLLIYLILKFNYRSTIDFNDTVINENLNNICEYYKIFKLVDDNPSQLKEGEAVFLLREEFILSMDDDFNTPGALVALAKWTKELPELLKRAPEEAKGLKKEIVTLGRILGLFPEDYDSQRIIEEGLGFQRELFGAPDLSISQIEGLIDQRWEARKAKNWALSDEIRDKLASMGISIKDSKEGTDWYFAIVAK